MRLNQVTVRVKDIKRAFEFYRNLGLIPIVAGTDHYARFLCPDGDSTFSIELSRGETPHSTTTVYFECEDLDKTVAELQAKGFHFTQGPVDQSWLWREAYLSDPDGNVICLFYAGENRINPPWRLKE